MTRSPGRPKKGTVKHYLTNKDFVKEIIFSKAQNKLTPKAEEMMILLGKRAITKMYYKSQNDRDDCLMTAYLDMFNGWRNFDPSRSNNAFAYFTEIAKRGFARSWNILYRSKGDPDGKTITFSYTSFGDDDENVIGWMI